MMLLKIATLGLISLGLVVLAEETRNRRHDAALGAGLLGAAKAASALGAAKTAATVGKGIAGASAAAGAAAAAGAGKAALANGALGGLGAGLGGLGAGAHAGKKVVIDINTHADAGAAHGGCVCGNPKLEEFFNNFGIFLRAYTSKELLPELKAVGAKFVDHVLTFLAHEKPHEMAAVQSILQTSAQVAATANANSRAGTVTNAVTSLLANGAAGTGGAGAAGAGAGAAGAAAVY